jgi:hypothetical protein
MSRTAPARKPKEPPVCRVCRKTTWTGPMRAPAPVPLVNGICDRLACVLVDALADMIPAAHPENAYLRIKNARRVLRRARAEAVTGRCVLCGCACSPDDESAGDHQPSCLYSQLSTATAAAPPPAPTLSEEDARYLSGFVRILRTWGAHVPVEVLAAAMQAGEAAVRGSSCDVNGCRKGNRCGWVGHRGES